jgi:hypothetical protein
MFTINRRLQVSNFLLGVQMKLTRIKGYEVKNIISNIGHDLSGFKCSLYFNNKKIATVMDDGFGGGYSFYFVNKEVELQLNEFIDEEYKIRIKTWKPKDEIQETVGFIFDSETFIYELVELNDKIKNFKNICKKHLAFQLDADIGTDKYNIIKNVPYKEHQEDIKKTLKERYKDSKLLIINELVA